MSGLRIDSHPPLRFRERSMVSAILGLTVGFCYALSHFMVRLGLDRSNPDSAVAVSIGVNAVFLWVLAIAFSPIRPVLSWTAWPFVLAGLFAPTFARMLLYRGVDRIGLARSAALLGAAPLFAVMLAVPILGERPSIVTIMGTFAIVIGVFVLNFSRAPRGEWTWWVTCLPLGAALCFGLRDFLTKKGLGSLPIPLSAAAVTATTSLFVFLASSLLSKHRERLVLPKRSFWLFLGSGMFLMFSYICSFFALRSGLVSQVSPLMSVSPLFSIILSYLFLQSEEKVTGMVACGAVLIVAGALSITLG